MAAIVGEELLATEAAAGAEAGASEAAATEGQFQYSGGGIGGARYGDAIGFEGYGLNPEYAGDYRGIGLPEHPTIGDTNGIGGSSAFRTDTKPKGLFTWNNFFKGDAVVNIAGGALQGITQTIADTYNNYRKDKQLKLNSRESLKDRYRAGIVFIGQENRDKLVRENRMPAYYSTSNIKSLLRRGIMPFGWNSEMAIEQGFGKEVMAQEQKSVTTKNAKHLLQQQREKMELRRSLGELKNLRDKFKTRKILEYYNQQ